MPDRLRQIPRSTVALAIVAVLLAIALAVKRTPLRPLSTAEIAIPSQPIIKGQAVKAEAEWSPSENVDVVGWAFYARTPGSVVTLLAADRKVLARVVGGSDEMRPQFVTTGTSHRLWAGDALKLRLDIVDAGGAEETHRTIAMVYYLPVR